MVGTMSVQDHANLLRQQIVHFPEMHENDRIRWFHASLSPQLKPRCIVDQSGYDFTSVEVLIRFAVGQERRNVVIRKTHPAPSLVCLLTRVWL